MRRAAFVMMCFAPQLRVLMPQAGFAMLLVGATLAYFSLSPPRMPRVSLFFCAYFVAFGSLGLLVQLFGYTLPGGPPPRPLFFYALTTLALVLSGLAMIRQGDSQFVLRVLCTLLVAEIAVVGLQFAYISYGVGLAPRDDAVSGQLIEGSYGNPNNVALVLAMLLMVLVMSGHVRMSSMFGAAIVLGTLAAVFLTLSRTALVFLALFLAVAAVAPRLRTLTLAATIRAFRRSLPVLAVLGAALVFLFRTGAIENLEGLAVVERSIVRVGTLLALDQDASVGFRTITTVRLIDALGSLGMGSLSDQNYGEFFLPGDPALATVNPHSYVVEMAFLFGYPGLLMALTFLVAATWRMIAASRSRRLLVVVFAASVLFFQMVPSSVFALDIFFLLVAIAGTRSLHRSQQPTLRRTAAPSLAPSQVHMP